MGLPPGRGSREAGSPVRGLEARVSGMEKVYNSVPKVDYFFMGGSSTFSIRFPEDLGAPGVQVVERKLVFRTPYGESPIMKLFEVDGKLVLTTKMHGRRLGVSRADSSRQVFWVAREAGVKRILAEGGAGAINHLLELRDLILCHDYIDLSLRRDVELGGPHLLVMRDPVCPQLQQLLYEVAAAQIRAKGDGRRLFRRGIYAVTDGRHWESRAEVQMLKQMGADVVGQSLCPEVYLAREIGACYGRIDMIVNYAEGIVEDWKHEDLKDIFYNEAHFIGQIMLEALRRVDLNRTCQCADLKKPTLLVDREYAEG